MLPRSLYVLGGRARSNQHDEWRRYDQALIFTIYPEENRLQTTISYRSPAEACPDVEPAITFKSGTLLDNRLYACTQTEILIYDLPSFSLRTYISLPCFNDVHHVRPTPWGTLLVVVTGLDMVLEIELSGAVVRGWNVLGEPLWRRFSRNVDYRRIATTKPHLSHPNFSFLLGEEIWATRFEQQDAVCLDNLGKNIDIGIEGPHDGVVHQDKIYFTTVDGHIIVVDSRSREVLRTWDLRKLEASTKLLGWCRGLKILEPDRFIVGFTRLRPTRFLENLDWVKRQARGLLVGDDRRALPPPTRLWGIDLAKGEVFWEFDLEEHGMNAIFSVH